MKTLKDLFEVYKPKAKGEQDFVDKHVVIKHKDRNGNGDDVFKGNTKPVNRKKELHGYDPGDDEKVYEETDELDELNREMGGIISRYINRTKDDPKREAGRNLALKKRWGDKNYGTEEPKVKAVDRFKEEVELDESWYQSSAGERVADLASKSIKNGKHSDIKSAIAHHLDMEYPKARHTDAMRRAIKRVAHVKLGLHKEEVELDEGKFVVVDHNKKILHMADTHAAASKKAAAKGLSVDDHVMSHAFWQDKHGPKNEEVEKLDELSRKTLASYVKKAGGRGLDSAGAHGMDYGVKVGSMNQIGSNNFSPDSRAKSLKKTVNRATGVERAADRLAKEDVDLDEAVSISHDRYLRSHGKKASGSGAWIFTHKKNGNIDLSDDKASHIGKGKFSDAAKAAKKWAKEHGHTTVYVAEDFNEDVVRTSILEMAEIEGLDLTEEELDVIVTSIIDEEAEQIDEISKDLADRYIKKAKRNLQTRASAGMNVLDKTDDKSRKKAVNKAIKSISKMPKRMASVDLAKEKFRKNGTAKVSATSKYTKEESQIEEKVKNPYAIGMAAAEKSTGDKPPLKKSTIVKGHEIAKKVMAKEEVEELDELSKDTLKNYTKKAANRTAYHTAQQMVARDPANMEYHGKKAMNKVADISKAVDRLTKEDVINNAIAKYAKIDESNLPTREERLISKLDGLSESHVNTLVAIFNGLNEDNQMKMLATADSQEGILSLLDFAIENKGA